MTGNKLLYNMEVFKMVENEWVTLIQAVGFPIVAYLLMFFKFDKSLETLRTAIDNNTKAINILLERENKQ